MKTFHLKDILDNEKSKEEEWAKHVASTLNEDHHEGQTTWSAHHAAQCTQKMDCLWGLFPLFRHSSTEPATILHAMIIVCKSVK